MINSGHSIRRIVMYNENKIEAGVAKCLMAANYPCDLEQLDKSQRLSMLLRTAELNPDVKRSSIHISLNFAPGEQLSDSKLKEIATEYMQQIGFGSQPFLVYRHDDAAHAHLHITTVKIRPDGSRIPTQNIGKDLSEPARKSIEIRYGLVKAEQQKSQQFELKPVDASKVVYGKQPTKQAISNVLQAVLKGYKFTSLPELNAVLNLYNIHADRGGEASRSYIYNGLIYKIIDKDGNTVGVPIKASSLYNNPGLRFLEKQYVANDVARFPHKTRLKNAIDLVILRNPQMDLNSFVERLKKDGITTTARVNDTGLIYGLTFIDHRTKCVFNGSAIGKSYSAKGIIDRLSNPLKLDGSKAKTITGNSRVNNQMPDFSMQKEWQKSEKDAGTGLLEELMQPEYATQNIPYEWRKKKKKRKKR